KRRPRGHFPRPPRLRPTSRHLWFRRSGQKDVVIFILAGVVDGCAGIEPSEPRTSWAIVEYAGIGAIVRQRAGKRRARHKFARKPNSFANWSRLKLEPRQIGGVKGKGQSANIPGTED